MRSMFRPAIMLAVALAAVPNIAPAQRVSSDSLLRRIEALEARLQRLEARGSETTVQPTSVAGRDAWKDIQAWRRLRRGMSEDQVRAILGEPARVNGGGMAFWFYGKNQGDAYVVFISDQLSSWEEPRR